MASFQNLGNVTRTTGTRRNLRQLFNLLVHTNRRRITESMEEEEDDDIYAPEDAIKNDVTGSQSHLPGRTVKDENMGEDLEEGEEEGEEVEEDESDSVQFKWLDLPFLRPNCKVAGHRHHHRAER